MKSTVRWGRFRVNGGGECVVSHAGAALLREMAEYTGLAGGVSAALADTYAGP